MGIQEERRTIDKVILDYGERYNIMRSGDNGDIWLEDEMFYIKLIFPFQPTKQKTTAHNVILPKIPPDEKA